LRRVKQGASVSGSPMSPERKLLVAAAAAVAAVAAFAGAAGAASPSATPTATVSGQVTVNGAPFRGGAIRFGSLVNILSGTITLKTGVGTLEVHGVPYIPAAFVLRFTHVNGEPYVQLQLAKGNFAACPKRTTASARASTKIVRSLWGDGKGNFQTSGRFAAATVRGTMWQTDDRCDGTWLRVVRGVVVMTDFKTGKNTTVRAGHTHLVLAK